MPTANERRALWFLALVALSGSVVRLARARGPASDSGADAGLERQLARVDSARERRNPGKSTRKKAMPRSDSTKNAGPLDLDRATAAEIEALPGIGPALAERIVIYRDSAGAFRSTDAFCAVKGVGPALVNRLRSQVVFSGVRVGPDACKVVPARSSKSHVTNRKKSR